MARRAAQLKSLEFSLEFPDEDTTKMAYAIEYGHRINNTIVPPCPFMRATRNTHSSEWNDLLEKLGKKFVECGYGMSLDDVAEPVAERMEDDYKDSAITYGVPTDIYDGLRVVW